MSLESSIGDLIANVTALTQQVAGKMGSIDALVQQEIANLEAWKNNSRNDFQNLFAQTIWVGGDQAKWYPVVFDLPHIAEGEIHVVRHVHTDSNIYGNWNGDMYLGLRGLNGEWGGKPGALYPLAYRYNNGAFSTTPPVASFGQVVYGMQAAVWLLGNRHYDVATSYPATVAPFFAQDTANLVYGTSPTTPGAVLLDAKTAVDASMIPNNYLRGG